MFGKKLKQKLKEGHIVIGTSLQELGTPVIGKLIGRAGFDWAGIELEHIQLNPETLFNLIMAANSVDLPIIVKVPELSRNWVCRSLDAGAAGVRLPWTETKEEVDRLVEWVKYPPIGKRALFFGANSDYLEMNVEDYIKEANDSTLVFAHIETKKGIENLDDILSNEHVDVAIIGPYDLSASLGVPGDLEHPSMIEAYQTMIEKCENHKVVPGTYVDNFEEGRKWIERGMKCIECSSDRTMLYERALHIMKDFRELLSKKLKGS